jgi:AmmeMemoRadiSam system protein B/AmmeMemoRadiSam system protein A
MKNSICLVLFAIFCSSCKAKEAKDMPKDTPNEPKEAQKRVIVSPVAGSWYTDDPVELRQEITSYLQSASIEPLSGYGGRIYGVISPHAGYRYSGKVAAHSYKALQGKAIKRVIVLGPSHYLPLRGIALPDASQWKTPLGEIEIDNASIETLKGNPLFETRNDAFTREHSLDMQMPFLQIVAPQAKIVPLVVGKLGIEDAKKAGDALRKIVDDQTVVVASSDFTHYGPNYGYLPFKDNKPENLRKLAENAFKAISSMDAQKLFEHLEATDDTICGAMPISVLMETIPKSAVAVPLKFDTSGNIVGDYTNSVSYFSIAFVQAGKATEFEGVEIVDKETQRFLLKLSRDTLRRHVQGEAMPEINEKDVPKGALLKYGVFVTLKEHGDLRGCIGSIIGVEPLFKGVINNTINAASHDPRFEPVSAREEPEIEIEISILTPPQGVRGNEDIRLGRDGIILEKDGRRALFLPQVAPEQGWDLETTLAHLSMKAGLRSDAWRQGAHFQTFQAHVFHESEHR